MSAQEHKAATAASFVRIRYESPEAGIVRIVLARAEKQNAQDRKMLYEIDQALTLAAADDDVRVIIVAADGPNFSAGHDLYDDESLDNYQTVGLLGGFSEAGQPGMMSQEEEIYLGFCWRWRNLQKPTIVQVQGKVIAGGLMLVWPFDLVVASTDATFSDPVCALGVNGHEYFTHVWEVGARRAKEMLFTGAELSADECRQLGMVNHVVPRAELESFTLGVARKIIQRPAFALRLAKLAVNQSLDAQGQWTAIRAAFGLHQLGHAHCRYKYGTPIEPAGIELIRQAAKGGIEPKPG